MATVRERMRIVREERGLSQDTVAEWFGISKQAYGKKERGEADGFSPEDFAVFVEKTEIDARWLFGQLGDIPFSGGDLRISKPRDSDVDTIAKMAEEYRRIEEQRSKRDWVAEKVTTDPELRSAVELLVRNRSFVSRVIGYLEIKELEKVKDAGEERGEEGANRGA